LQQQDKSEITFATEHENMGKTQPFHIIKLAIHHQLNPAACPLRSLSLCHRKHSQMLLKCSDLKESFCQLFLEEAFQK